MKLPLWRLVLGLAVLVSLVLVLFALGPIYLDDYRLKSFTNKLASTGGISTLPDERIRQDIVKEAKELDLPVQNGDVTVTHFNGKTNVELKYIVDVNFPLYNVDLHFHTSAQGK